jgi:hypothetical protein
MARSEPIIVALVLAVVACARERARDDQVVDCPTWRDDVADELRACAGCHDFADYAAVLDAQDEIVAALDPATADVVHRQFAGVHELVVAWLRCDAPYFTSRIHPGGILNPRSPEFHGQEVAARGWDLRVCARCHGDDFAGGTSAATCRSCHDAADGPAACDTCHPAAPVTAAHPAHAGRWSCAECHVVPVRWDDPGHVLGDDGPPAEARYHDPATGTCTVWCHGDVRPRWTGGPGEAACGTCHAVPPPDHVSDQCVNCHPTGPAHVDGVLQVGRTDGCDGCHGGGGDPAPPVDLWGNEFTTAPGVGAHQSHLEGPHRIAGTIPCSTCHVVPSTLHAAGHVDTPPPAEVTAVAGWNRATGRCANACHGVSTPVWTAVGQGEIACGSCHGIPPPSHDPTLRLTDCVTCHSGTVTPFGGIIVTGPPDAAVSRHINGTVEVD